MRRRSQRSMLLAGAIAAWYCAAALTQTTGAQGTRTPASQPNPTPASTSNPTPASNATPTTASPRDERQNDQTFPAATRNRTNRDSAIGTSSQPQAARCAGLTGIPRAECERRDAPDDAELPAGMTRGQMERQSQRAAEAARETQTRSSADAMRAPPASAEAASTTTPDASAPAPSSTPREDADTLNRPRE